MGQPVVEEIAAVGDGGTDAALHEQLFEYLAC